uniref:Kelch repeat-containing F-box family protein n=1 Tax=Kalanchoe fedtschenkoi TaxID=63787 RepID=A0A7N0T769_KALFE
MPLDMVRDSTMENRRWREGQDVAGGVCCNSLWLSSRLCSPKKVKLAAPSGSMNLDDKDDERLPGVAVEVEPQDADYAGISLSDELENLISARVPRSESWKFFFINRRFLSLMKSGELYQLRRDIGFREPSVFVLASGDSSWVEFDRCFNSCRKLPAPPTDIAFTIGDKETFCAGNHLLVLGKEFGGKELSFVIWRYDLATNGWFRGPDMEKPRCLFASASCGDFAYVAGGIGSDHEVLNSAEKYDPENKMWESLPGMKRRRKFSSGIFMDEKFFVVGGRDENNNELTCGEAFDEARRTWELIPDMVKEVPVLSSQSPPLIAVVNNELYSLEAASNELKAYVKATNAWKSLGPVPVRADFNRGWGVAFRSLGNELLVIGASSAVPFAGHGMSIYSCCPDPNAPAGDLRWKALDSGRSQRSSHFIRNCAVMLT